MTFLPMKKQVQGIIDDLESAPEQPICSGQLAGVLRRLFRLSGGEEASPVLQQPSADSESETPAATAEQTVPQLPESPAGEAAPAEALAAGDAPVQEVAELRLQIQQWQTAYDALENEYTLRGTALKTQQEETERLLAEKAELQASKHSLQEELQQTKGKLAEAQKAAVAAAGQNTVLAKENVEQRTELEKSHAQLTEAQQKLSSLETETESLRTEQAAVRAQVDELKKTCEEARMLQAHIWPSCLHVPALQRFEASWTQSLGSAETDRGLLSMFAYMFCWTSAVASETSDGNSETLAQTALYNFCRYLTAWLYRNGESAESVYSILSELAESLNRELASSGYEVDVPVLDSPYSAKSMNPSASGRNVGSVAAIDAWAIKSSGSAIYKKKAIVKLI